jgi:fluoride ion exporter CrcB/FEX
LINIFWVAAGGALGASLRFVSSSFFNLFFPNLPIGTFSSFSYEVIELYNNKKLLLSIIYILASVFSCIVAAYAGYSINKV